jgi:hypothetical protein
MFKSQELTEIEQIQRDLRRLRALVAHFGALEEAGEADENQQRHGAAFRDMLSRMESGRLRILNGRMRDYVKAIFERDCGPEYENLVSSGKVPEGKKVPTPAVLKPENLPKLPPHRRPR